MSTAAFDFLFQSRSRRWLGLSSASSVRLIFVIGLCCLVAGVSAAPFAKYFHFTQPDGTQLTLWGEGDDFHAVFETTAGYTVLFDPQRGAYVYAVRAADGKSLVGTGMLAHRAPPVGLAQHIRMDPDAVAAGARARQQQWDQDMRLSERWTRLKSLRLGKPVAPEDDGPVMAPPPATTLGPKTGLTLLIDFADDVATVPQTEIDAFCNADDYTGFGNNGSVKKYFSDVSGARLTYSNVVTIYIRMTQPKSFYNNVNKDAGLQGRALITDALQILKARSDYNSVILPTFSNLTTDGSGLVLAFNVFFAGANSGVWAKGLWPHSWALASPVALGNGKSVYWYQITDIGDALELGTFCHENGHMLCDFPDIYDYDYDSIGGAGVFCLMSYGGSGVNPSQVCAYLKLAAGWATVTDIENTSALTGTLVAAPNAGYDHFYRYRKPGVSTEYFLMENRQKAGRDAGLPASGVALWHVDELGNRDNQSLTANSSHLNYELTLVQADNLWHFENNVNDGDANDLYYFGNGAAGYVNRLADVTAPNSRWWDGTVSGMDLSGFSAPGLTMTFAIGTGGSLAAPALAAEPPGTSGTENTISWSAVSAAPSSSPVVGQVALEQAPPTEAASGTASDRTQGVAVFSIDASKPPSYVGGTAGWNWSGSLSIPDGTGQEAGLNCTPPTGVPTGAIVTGVELHHEITHPNVGDLVCRLYNSDHEWIVRNREGGSANNVSETRSSALFNGHSPVQNWYYRVLDALFPRAGTLNRMQLWVSYDAPTGPDLRPSWASWASGAVTEGAPFWVQASIVNNGTTDAGASHVKLYLSTDNDTDISDDYPVGEQAVDALAAGGSQTVQWDFNKVPDLGSGNYTVWLLFVVDSGNAVVETDENNTFKTTVGFAAGDPLEYYAECSADAGFGSPVNSGWIQQLQYTFSNLTPGQTYWYRVKTRWTGQESGWSESTFSRQGPYHVSGVVEYYTVTQKVAGVTMAFNGNDFSTVATSSDGSYNGNLISGWSGTSSPARAGDTPADNGVDSFDQFLIQEHILERHYLDSPYQVLAADVDGSGLIDSYDQFLIQWVILQRDTQFPLGQWRFVPADYIFADPLNPWAAPANRVYTDVLADVAGQNFVALMFGDVDGSWVASGGGALKPSPELGAGATQVSPSVGLAIETQNGRPGERIKAAVKSRGFEQLTTLQFTLAWDPSVLRFSGCNTFGLRGMSSGNLRVLRSKGRLLCAWYDPATEGVTIVNGTSIMQLEFEVVGRTGSSTPVAFVDTPAKRQASLGRHKVLPVTEAGIINVVARGR